jgi:ubiquitin C-terminal hydrolase
MPSNQQPTTSSAAVGIEDRNSLSNIPRLPNDSRSCFANAVLQCLHRLSDLYGVIASATFADDEVNRVAIAFRNAIDRVPGRTARNLRKVVGRPFSGSRDQDAVEFLEKLLTIFEEVGYLYQFSVRQDKTCSLCGYHAIVPCAFDHFRLSAVTPNVEKLNFDTISRESINALSFPVEERIDCPNCNDRTHSVDFRSVDSAMPQ